VKTVLAQVELLCAEWVLGWGGGKEVAALPHWGASGLAGGKRQRAARSPRGGEAAMPPEIGDGRWKMGEEGERRTLKFERRLGVLGAGMLLT